MPVKKWIEKIKVTDAIKFEGGYLNLMSTPAYLFSLNCLVIMNHYLRESQGKNGLEYCYREMELQGVMAANMMLNRFGYSKEEALKMQIGHGAMIGAGEADLMRSDFKKNKFIVKVNSTFAKEYIKTFGIQNEPVCTLNQGVFTGLFRTITGNKNLICIETQCIAMGKSYCEYVIKEKKEFNLKDKKIVNQIYDKGNIKIDYAKLVKKMGVPVRELNK